MLEIFLNGVVWVLAIYGLIEIIKTIIYIITYTDLKSDGIYLIVAAKNQEEKIEGFLRSIIFRLFYEKDISIKNIIVADLDSSDKTMEIVEKLHNDYEYIQPIKWRECKNIIDNIDKS